LSTYAPLFLSEAYASLKTHDNHRNDVEFISYFWSKDDTRIDHAVPRVIYLYRPYLKQLLGFLLEFFCNERAEACIVASWSSLIGTTFVASIWTSACCYWLYLYL
jgi:hypothetical protein